MNRDMQQSRDSEIISHLSNVHVADARMCEIKLIKSRVIHSDYKNYTHDALYIFEEKANACKKNLQSVKRNLHSIAASKDTKDTKDYFHMERQGSIELKSNLN